ncbi:MAG TPA: hybrid sensor histidine kinase/response regulator [Candidatus Acidoferrales bacterium]|nr:hybrid sensor histidine kinase/response regulator [Candidatus Acidoferrales bacterium]
MTTSAVQQEIRVHQETRIAPPKPRSLQSRFILMEAASVVLALVLMAGALGISFLIRSRLTNSVGELRKELSLHTQIQDAFDKALVDFWRAYRTPDEETLQRERADARKLQDLVAQGTQMAVFPGETEDSASIEKLVDDHIAVSNRLLAGTESSAEKAADERNLRNIEAQITALFATITAKEFQRLSDANRQFGGYNRLLYVLLFILGMFPVVVMLWLRYAQERNLWEPLEQLYRMVMEVKRGNLNVKARIPDTVELGSLTAAFLSMAEELGDMRDSLEEKVRVRAAQLETAGRDLLRAAKLAALGQLVSGVAHEINNPLTSILGFSEVVLSRRNLDSSMRSQLQTIRTEAIRLKHLVANLSTFSRQNPQNFSRIDLRTVPDHLLQLRSYQLAANNIKIRYDRPEKPVWVDADGEQLLEVLLHLVLNAEQAIRSVRDKGEIRLLCEAHDGRASLSVKDDGCGMPEEVREHIFDPFFTTKSAGRGTGLGLSISHTIVDQHGGRLDIESAAGVGTTVHISLPLVQNGGKYPMEHSAGVRKEVALESETSGSKKTLQGSQTQTGSPGRPHSDEAGQAIPAAGAHSQAQAPDYEEKPSHAAVAARILAIDDEPEILSLVSLVLARTGAQVVTLQDTTRLESVLGESHFDAVLCDLKMPGQDGLAILRCLREKRPDLARRFLLMTGNLADADKAQIELEGVPILPKPFTLAGLREKLGQVLAVKD